MTKFKDFDNNHKYAVKDLLLIAIERKDVITVGYEDYHKVKS